MIHTFVGNLGQLSVVTAFVSALVAAFSFYKSVTVDKLEKEHLPSSGSPTYSVDWQKGLEDHGFVDKTIERWRRVGQ